MVILWFSPLSMANSQQAKAKCGTSTLVCIQRQTRDSEGRGHEAARRGATRVRTRMAFPYPNESLFDRPWGANMPKKKKIRSERECTKQRVGSITVPNCTAERRHATNGVFPPLMSKFNNFYQVVPAPGGNIIGCGAVVRSAAPTQYQLPAMKHEQKGRRVAGPGCKWSKQSPPYKGSVNKIEAERAPAWERDQSGKERT